MYGLKSDNVGEFYTQSIQLKESMDKEIQFKTKWESNIVCIDSDIENIEFFIDKINDIIDCDKRNIYN